MTVQLELVKFIVEKCDDLKAKDITVLDVQGQTAMTDHMIVVSGTSSQHVRSIASNLITEAKHAKLPISGSEGQETGEWVLVDLGDAVVHVMLPAVREYYQIEKLWSVDSAVCESK